MPYGSAKALASAHRRPASRLTMSSPRDSSSSRTTSWATIGREGQREQQRLAHGGDWRSCRAAGRHPHRDTRHCRCQRICPCQLRANPTPAGQSQLLPGFWFQVLPDLTFGPHLFGALLGLTPGAAFGVLYVIFRRLVPVPALLIAVVLSIALCLPFGHYRLSDPWASAFVV